MLTRLLPVLALVAGTAMMPAPALAAEGDAPPTSVEQAPAAAPAPDPAPASAPDPAPAPPPVEEAAAPAPEPAAKAADASAPVARAASAKPEKPTGPPAAPKDTPKKVYVCKYVGTPGDDETLQNVIEVSVNTLKDFTGSFPSTFPDAQGRSIAIGYAGGDEPVLGLDDCPAADGGDPTDPVDPVDPVEVPKKVYVCKYVGTPGVDEELQTGQNPIEVSVNALDDGFPGTFPWSFTDAQGRSVAIGYVGEDLPVLDVDDCPAADGGDPTDPVDPVDPVEVPKKVYVCKYVGTPGVDEELQTGQNPIEVSVNALDDGFPGTFPWSFTDAQGRSVAIGYVGDGLPVPTIEDCTPDVTDPEPLAATPQFATAPTCPTDGGMPRALFVLDGLFTAVITPTVGVIATFTEGDGITGPWELTFTPADGYTLVDDEGEPLESPYVVSGDAGVAADCDEIVVVDPEPTGVTPAFTTEPTCAVDDAVSALVAIDGLNRVSVVPTAGVVAQFTQGDGLTGPWTLEFTPVEGFELVDGEGDPLGVPYVVSGDAGVAADCDEIVVVDPGGDPDPDEPTEETGTSGDDETGTAGISDAGGTLPNAGGTSLWLLAAGAMLALAGMTVLRRGSRSDDAAPTSVAVGHVATAGPPPSAALPALVAPASLTSRAAPRRVLRRRDLAWLGAAVAIALGIGVRRQRA